MRITFGVGTGFDKANKPIPALVRSACLRAAMHVLSEEWGGVFVQEGKGAWVDNSKRLIVEDSVQFIVETGDAAIERVRQSAAYLRGLFNQSSVIASVSQSDVSFHEESTDVIPFPLPSLSGPLQNQA